MTIENEDDFEFVSLDTTNHDSNLAEVCFKVVEWWMEDNDFESLLEEFDVLPEDAFYTLMKAGLIDEERLKAFLTSDE